MKERRRVLEIPAGIYGKNQKNEASVVTIGSPMMFAATAKIDEETVYKLTKAFWENVEQYRETGGSQMKKIKKESALRGMILPIHPGAEKYYKETGILKFITIFDASALNEKSPG